MATLVIDNKEVNLKNNIVLSKKAYPFNDWNSIRIDFSELVLIDYAPFIKFKQYYNFTYKDNSQILFNGIAILIEQNNKETMSIQLLDKSKLLFDYMTENKFTSFNLDIHDFVFNLTSYNTFKQLNSKLWIWSADNTHEKRTLSNNILNENLAFSRPYFSVKRLLELIFNEQKWSYELSANTSLLDSLIISSNHKEFYFTSFEKKFIINENITSYDFDFTNYDFIKTDIISNNTTLKLNYDSQIRFRGNIYSSKDCILTFNCVSESNTDTLIESYLIKKGLNYYDITTAILETEDTTYNITINLSSNCQIITDDLLIYTIISENAFGDISLSNFINFKVKTYDNIIDLSLIELFKQSLVFVGGFFTTNNLRKKIKINSLNQLFRLNSLDYSNKFVEKSEVFYSLDNYAKKNYFRYNTSKDKKISDNYFNINNNSLNETKDIFKSVFEASSEVFIDNNNIIDNVIYTDIERKNNLNMILGYYENVLTYSIARFKRLNSQNLFVEFYDNYIKALRKGEIIEAEFYLTKTDYYNFDFNKLIYISQLNSTFYVIEINGYKENDKTKLKLLKA